MTKLRDIARILSRTEAANTDNQRLLIAGEAFDSNLATPIINSSLPAISSIFQTHDSLPTDNLSMGDTALVIDSEKYYFSDGNIWYSVGVFNQIPDWDAAFTATYEVADEDTNLVITNTASDSDDPDGIFTYSGEVYAPQVPVANTLMTSITVDSDVGSWTFNAAPETSVLPVYDADGTGGSTFKYIFRATDGINTITDSATIDWTFPSVPPVTWPSRSTYGGTTYGYAMGGQADTDRMERWSLSSDGNAAFVGNLGSGTFLGGSGGSGTYGYVFGSGLQWQKYQYSSDTDVYNVRDTTFPNNISQAATGMSGNRSKGYLMGTGWPSPANSSIKNYYDRITYSTDTWATNVGTLTTYSDTYGGMVNSSPTQQYTTGGGIYRSSFPYGESVATSIYSFPFASEGATSDIGYDNLWPYSASLYGSSASSTTYGYNFGGVNYQPAPDTYSNSVTKFPFANNSNSTLVGSMASAKATRVAGVSSTSHGYMAGGVSTPWSPDANGIGKFSFASDANATDVGDLTYADYGKTGGQY